MIMNIQEQKEKQAYLKKQLKWKHSILFFNDLFI